MKKKKPVERIVSGKLVLAHLIYREYEPRETRFITAPEATMQAGMVIYPAKGKVQPHIHVPVKRQIPGTSEMIFVKKGRCEVSIYTPDGKIAAKKIMRTGDAVIFLAGGHGFKMLEDTVLFEIKQGPYIGISEKKYIR